MPKRRSGTRAPRVKKSATRRATKAPRGRAGASTTRTQRATAKPKRTPRAKQTAAKPKRTPRAKQTAAKPKRTPRAKQTAAKPNRKQTTTNAKRPPRTRQTAAKPKRTQTTEKAQRASRTQQPTTATRRAHATNARATAVHATAEQAPTAAVPDWRPALRAAVDATGADFAVFLAGLGAAGWEHADSPELAGLEHWATELARRDRRAGLGALVRTAMHGLPIIFERAGIGIDGMGFKASEPSVDGAPVERQVQLAAAWLDAPDRTNLDAVRTGNDPARQMQIWDEDLRPNDDRAHWWYQDVGQCCGYAITRSSGSPNGASYYEWPPETCIGRGLVLAVRGLRERGANLREILAQVRAVLAA